MPNTRKKVIKTVYKDEDDSEAENSVPDFSDSGSDAKISEQSSSEDDCEESGGSSGEEFVETPKEKPKKTYSRTKTSKLPKAIKPPLFSAQFMSKIHKQASVESDDENGETSTALFSVKDLTEADKLLPSVLNLSESDSSDDESLKQTTFKPDTSASFNSTQNKDSDSDEEMDTGYRDVWSSNIKDNSEEIAKKTFADLEREKNKIEETKASLLKYSSNQVTEIADVKDLLAQGEEVLPQTSGLKIRKKKDNDSDSEMEDWEEVKENKGIPQQGLKLVVGIPDSICRKTKKLDIEMMMKRRINRVKKEHQVSMHKVHVLCWLGHGNYVSKVLNDQEIMAAALSLVPSKECYPGERVDMKYVEQITTWYKDKVTLKQDKNEDKFRPKAPPLKDIMLAQSKSRVVTTKKYMVFIFVSMLRALGLQCRVMFNFVTVPLKPPSSELCSLSTKTKDEKKAEGKKNAEIKKSVENKPVKTHESKNKSKAMNLPQVDGNYDSSSDEEFDNIMQLDGSDDVVKAKAKSVRSTRAKTNAVPKVDDNEDVSPPKRAKKSPSPKPQVKNTTKENTLNDKDIPPKRTRAARKFPSKVEVEDIGTDNTVKKAVKKENASRRKPAEKKPLENNKMDVDEIPVTNKLNGDADNKTVKKETARGRTPSVNNDIFSKTNKADVDQTSDETEVKSELTDKAKGDTKVKAVKKEAFSHRNANKKDTLLENNKMDVDKVPVKSVSPRKTRNTTSKTVKTETQNVQVQKQKKTDLPKIVVTNNDSDKLNTSKYFESTSATIKTPSVNRMRSSTANPDFEKTSKDEKQPVKTTKSRTKSASGNVVEKSRFFNDAEVKSQVDTTKMVRSSRRSKKVEAIEDAQRVSHRDLNKKVSPKKDVTSDLVKIIKNRVREAKEEAKQGIVKGKVKQDSDEDSDFLPEEDPKKTNSDSDDDFKPSKISPRPPSKLKPKPNTSRKIDRRVISSDDETPKNKIDVWCEVFVEELEQWISVDVVTGRIHSDKEIYSRATHPVCYILGWDNNNYLKDLTRRYVPQWNTVTRKQRAEAAWFETSILPWRAPKTPRDREEDEQLNRMQLEAPLPKSIAEYKNHPLYALKRHLLKFEAIYPSDAAILGFVRNEPVYARECVYVCKSRDTWLKDAKVVKMGEKPYKVVKARPKWDKLSNKLITDKPLEVFGPWQIQDYEPPVAENGVVPRNAYGNVELFKDCMLPIGTVHIKLPGLNRVAKKLSIDCAPAMTGFDFNGGWSHPVYDGFVVCKEFEEIVTEAWIKDQEDQERREREKIENRVYGNWKRLIKGLFIKERLKMKYGFEEPPPVENKKKSKGPRLVVKKN